MATYSHHGRRNTTDAAPERQPPQDPDLCTRIEARLARLDYNLGKSHVDLSVVEASFRDLAALMPEAPPRNTIEPRTGLPSNLFLEARMKLDGALRKLAVSKCEEESGFSVNGFERSQECVQALKAIFRPRPPSASMRKLALPPRPAL